MSVGTPSAFERLHFDSAPVTVDRAGIDLLGSFGVQLTDEDIAHLSGAPGGAHVVCEFRHTWTAAETGADNPDPGLFFRVTHPWIPQYNHIGLCLIASLKGKRYFRMYLKDVSFIHGAAPSGVAGVLVARIARRCLKLGIPAMKLLAAGGRMWGDMQPGQRWGGFYAWPRYGFDMGLVPSDSALLDEFSKFPAHLVGPPRCATVQEVIRTAEGMNWWSICGTGWFMEFDCSSSSAMSIALLDRTLAAKGI